jgi:hypothetical protein
MVIVRLLKRELELALHSNVLVEHVAAEGAPRGTSLNLGAIEPVGGLGGAKLHADKRPLDTAGRYRHAERNQYNGKKWTRTTHIGFLSSLTRSCANTIFFDEFLLPNVTHAGQRQRCAEPQEEVLGTRD